MTLKSITAEELTSTLGVFDTIIDARSPAEFADDHLPGAVNWPVLDNDERREVGTEYKQVSAFDARKHGAAIVARRVAEIVEQHVADKPREWQPLVYCWRGGQRSGEIPPDIDPERMAEQYYGGLLGINNQWLVSPDFELAAAYEDFKRNMVRLLSAPRSTPGQTR